MEGISSAFERLVNALTKSPVATLVAIIILVGGYIGYRSYDQMEKQFLSTHFEQQLSSAALVNTAIENLRVDLQAKQVTIKQFHNGKYDLTGLPFVESSATFYTSRPEVMEEPISAMNSTLRIVWKDFKNPKCIALNRPIDHLTARIKGSLVICPLTNILDYPIGIIQVEFNEEVPPSRAILITENVGKRVTGYLQDAGRS